MIVGFSGRKTETFYEGAGSVPSWGFARTASRKLDQLAAATSLGDRGARHERYGARSAH